MMKNGIRENLEMRRVPKKETENRFFLK